MIILALETATSHQSVAVCHDQELLGYLECEVEGSLTQQLIPTIHGLLSSVSLQVSDLEGLAVSIGPGSFTGLRVALATMTAFRLALSIPLVGVSTLEGLAWNLPESEHPILSTVLIRSGQVYWGLFRWENHQVVSVGTEQIGELSEVCAAVAEPTWIVGDGWVHNQECLHQNCFPLIEAPANARWPSAKGIALAGRVLLENGEFLPEGCSPHYIQPSYAERAKPLTQG